MENGWHIWILWIEGHKKYIIQLKLTASDTELGVYMYIYH